MPQTTWSAFQQPPDRSRVHAPNWRKAVGLDPHIHEDATRFRREGAPRALHLPVLAEAERVERSRPFRIIVGFKPTKHAACEPLDWRRADHSKAMPQNGTHRLATACRTPPASLSVTGARLRTCTSRLPLTRRAHRYLCTSRCASTAKWHPRSELNTRNPPSEGRRRSSVGVGMNWHP